MAVKNILSISVDDETGSYKINIAEGSNVAETVFAISAMIRCFVRDGIIENYNTVIDMLKKYLADSQYEEVENDDV